MTQEEKAKRYDEALKEAKDCHIDGCALSQPVKDVLEHIFPELKESDYEQLRKEIISIVKTYRENCITEGNHRFDDCLAWLEKQSELNYSNATISENEKIKAFLIKTINQVPNDSLLWEEIDKASVIAWIEKQGEFLRLQNSWKPSDMELETLRLIAEKDGTCLKGLYGKLKKLK